MRILHCCLANFYIDNYGYQENILPKMHLSDGHEVFILASTETYTKDLELGYINSKDYFTSENIPIRRIPYVKWLPHFIAKKLRLYRGLKNYIEHVKPNIIFLHDCQFLSILEIVSYARNNKVVIYVDSHTDFINSGRNWVSKYFLHKFLYKFCAKSIEPYTTKFYGTLPLRNTFLNEVYNIDINLIELLPFGADDSYYDIKDKQKIRKNFRQQLNLSDNDFVLITGGKIDYRKNIHILLDAFNEIQKLGTRDNLKIIVFGKPTIDMHEEIMSKCGNKNVIYVDWIAPKDLHKYFFAADLPFFPGTHSVLWEEAVGFGLPCVFYKWEGIQHLDIGGNCLFIDDLSVENIKSTIESLTNNSFLFNQLKAKAEALGPDFFSYSNIAKKAIQ